MLRRLLSGGLLLAALAGAAGAKPIEGTVEGLEQIAAVIGAALPPECPILPLVVPPSLIVRAVEIDEPPEGDLAIEVQLSLTAECVPLAEQALRAARDQLSINGLRAIGVRRSSDAIVVTYG